jgi:hypothetical protein
VRRVLLLAGLGVLLLGCSDDAERTGDRCVRTEIEDVPDDTLLATTDEPVAVISLAATASTEDVAHLAQTINGDARVSVTPAYGSLQIVVSAPGGELTDRQRAIVFARARLHPQFDSIEGIACTESP